MLTCVFVCVNHWRIQQFVRAHGLRIFSVEINDAWNIFTKESLITHSIRDLLRNPKLNQYYCQKRPISNPNVMFAVAVHRKQAGPVVTSYQCLRKTNKKRPSTKAQIDRLLIPLQQYCSALQSKLDQLKSLAEGNFIENFIKEFVPKDLEAEDLEVRCSASQRVAVCCSV